MPFVVDVSMAAAWVLPDESSEGPERLLLQLPDAVARVPSLFWHEARNVLLIAERRGRIAPGEAAQSIARLRRLPLQDDGDGSDGRILALAAANSLSAYDAAYLALAVETRLPLATLDRKLAAAARRQAVEVVGPLGSPA